MKKILFTALVITAVSVGQASAGVITFDDLPGTITPIPNGYGGLTWNNFYYLDGINYFANPSGYQAGVVSRNNVAFNAFGTMAFFSAGTFSLNSAYLTAAWNDNLQVEVIGKLGGTTLYDQTYTLSATAPTLINFNYIGVDYVEFDASGGTLHNGYHGGGTQFAMDNLSINAVPEPSTFIAGALLAIPFGVRGFRALRRR